MVNNEVIMWSQPLCITCTERCAQVCKSGGYINGQNFWFLISVLKLYLGYLVDTMFYYKAASKTKHFIHGDILVPASKFVVLVIFLTGGCFIWVVVDADHCGHIPACTATCYQYNYHDKSYWH